MYAVCRQAHPAVPSLRARRCVECVWVGSHVFFSSPLLQPPLQVWHMLFLRAALGGVLGGVLPILYSLFGDLFPPSKRSTVSAVVGTASGGGTLVGQVLSGMLGSSYGWRAPYLFIATLGMTAVYLVHVKGEEPQRGEVF